MKKTLIIILILTIVLFAYTKWSKTPAIQDISKDLISWKLKTEVFEYDGYKLSYHDTKNESKKVVVLLHGYPTSSYDWHSIWNDLSKEYRLIAMDMLGFGFSDKPDNITYSTFQQADIQIALLKKLGVKEAHILAHDYGDNIAQEFLSRTIEQKEYFPLKIKSVTLLNGGLFPETHHPTAIQTLLKSPIGGIVSSFTNLTLFEKNFTKVFGANTQPSKQDIIDQWYLICQQNGHQINHKLCYASNDCIANRTRWVNALAKTNIPVLFINGQFDPVSGKETTIKYIELVPNSKVVKLDSVGHYPQTESPKELVIQFNSFVQKIDDSLN